MCLQAQLDDYMKRLEEAERNAQIAEAKIAERDQRIAEVERLLNCMAQVNNISWLSLCVLPLKETFYTALLSL